MTILPIVSLIVIITLGIKALMDLNKIQSLEDKVFTYKKHIEFLESKQGDSINITSTKE